MKLQSAYYCGDPRRGAAMGRSSIGEPVDKVHLRKVNLDSGGYDNGGAYWGFGLPLFRCYSKDGKFDQFFRADNREYAKRIMRSHFPTIQFLR